MVHGFIDARFVLHIKVLFLRARSGDTDRVLRPHAALKSFVPSKTSSWVLRVDESLFRSVHARQYELEDLR